MKQELASKFLRILHLHPCYLARIYCVKEYSPEIFYGMLKEIYSLRQSDLAIGTESYHTAINEANDLLNNKKNAESERSEIKRVNLLLVSFMRKVVSSEIDNFDKLEDVNLFDLKKTLIGKVFNRVFKSQK